MTPLRLRDVCTKIGSGATPRGGKEVYLESGEVALIRSQNVYNDRFERNGLAFIRSEHANQLRNVEVQANDVLLNITGDSVARVCQVPAGTLPARVNQHVAIIRTDPCRLDPRFLRFFLASPQMQANMLAFAAAGATRNALTKGMIEGFEVPNLSIEDQQAIAALLGSLEDKIELNRRMNETLEAMARAIFKDWFVDFGPTRAKAEGRDPYLATEVWDLFPDALDDDDKPVGWAIGTVADCAARVQNGGTPRRSEDAYWTAGAVPWLTSGEVRQDIIVETENYITELGLQNSSAKMLPERSILVALYGATAGQVAFSAIPLTTNQAVSAVMPRDGFRYFLLMHLKREVERLAESAVGSAQQNISKKIVEELSTPVPTNDCAFAFDRLVAPLFDRAVANLFESKTIARTRDLLLPKLMSGEIRLREAERAVEAVA